MPYIKQDKRVVLDPQISQLVAEIERHTDDNIPGVVNYVITKMFISLCERKCANYAFYNLLLGVLSAVGFELYRKKVALYEDAALERNGDILP